MSKSSLQFRVATLDDASRIQQLVESAFRAEDSRPRWTADMELGRRFRVSVDEIIPRITGPDSAILMATDTSGALLASVEACKKGADLARFSMLAVDQNQQRGGVGRQLLAHAEDYSRKTWGVKHGGLNALSTREELISWYSRCGYRETGERTPFNVQIEGVTLPDDLCFVEMEKDFN